LQADTRIILYVLHALIVEENIWTKEGWSDGKVEKAA
jgi:hypothetical protein